MSDYYYQRGREQYHEGVGDNLSTFVMANEDHTEWKITSLFKPPGQRWPLGYTEHSRVEPDDEEFAAHRDRAAESINYRRKHKEQP